MKALLVVIVMTVATAGLAVNPSTNAFVPSVAHGVGQEIGGVRSQWRADVWIFNPSATQTAAVKISLLLRNQANPDPTAMSYDVKPGETLYSQDVLVGVFGVSKDTYGALQITSNLPVAVTGSSYDANVTVESKKRGTGTAGQFFSGLPASSAISNGEFVDIVGLDQDGLQTAGIWRSNLALVETTGQPVSLLIERLATNGAVSGSMTYNLQAREARQINDVLTVIQPNQTGVAQRVRVRVTDGSGRVLASASRVDNRTGDPSTVESSGSGRDGNWVCKLDKTTYDTPVTLTVGGAAITKVDATILVTDEDAGAACTGGELLQLVRTFNPPVVLEDGAFSFEVTGSSGGVTATMQFDGAMSSGGALTGTVRTTLSGGTPCTAAKTWPLVGSRITQ